VSPSLETGGAPERRDFDARQRTHVTGRETAE
jgi:hypothetical protein